MGIKPIKQKIGKNIKTPSSGLDSLRTFVNGHPVFCFQFVQNGFTVNECTKDQKSHFVKRICDLSKMKWSQIYTERRDGMGAEKISYSGIKVPKPSILSKEIDFLVFRFGGQNCRFIGYQNDFIFHVIYIDPALKAYNH